MTMEAYSYFKWFNETMSLILSALICLAIYYITKFYLGLKQYPKGPFPLPILGNFLNVYTIKISSFEYFVNLSKIYGPIYTFWMGSKPVVIITDLKIAKEAFIVKRNEIAGRPYIKYFKQIFESLNASDVILNDYGPTWESLRRVAHDGVRKYSNEDKLAILVKDVVSETVNNILNNEGINKPFVPFEYAYFTLLNIIASSVFGVRYSIKDNEVQIVKSTIENWEKSINTIFTIEFIPLLKLFLSKESLYLNQKQFAELFDLAKLKYNNHQSDYQEDITRDLIDALIKAKNDSIKNSKESAPYLTDNSLAVALNQLFLAGVTTSFDTLKWAFLYMSNYPEMQIRMRKEVEDQIGDRMPVQDDRNNCHYINAFISECLRHRVGVPLSVPHKTICDVEINEHKIPKDTVVLMHTFAIMHDPEVFDDPDSFKPERFLQSNGNYISARHHGFIPFGMGRRTCPGEKLALADLFLIITNLLQLTSEYEFVLPDGPGSADVNPNPYSMNCVPNQYNILLKKVTK